MILLIDIGNTRIKWARLDGQLLGPQAAAPHAGWSADTIARAALDTGARAQRVLVSNVGGASLAAAVREAVIRSWNVEPEFIRSTSEAGGVRNAYTDPAKLGVDRWLAIIGAHALISGALCIVSLGTAMTIDGVDADGRHLGGVIVPGPDLMVSSLFRNTSDIAARAEDGSRKGGLFADNTQGAIVQGAEHALAALVERAVETLRRDLNVAPSLLLTGGASHRLDHALGLPCQIVPDLVLRGLAVLASAPRP